MTSSKVYQIVAVRSWGKGSMWEVETVDSDGRSRYSYWGKRKYPDELGAFLAAQRMLDGEIDWCDLAPTLPE